MRLGVLGFPIEHSLSPKIFSYLATKFNKNINYDVIQVPVEEFNFKTISENYDCLNVTFPYKEKIMNYVEFDKTASITRSVNAVNLKSGMGWNTDVTGFKSLLDYHTIPVKDSSVLICGGGASSRSVIKTLCDLGVKKIQLKLRDIFKFENAVKHFKVQYPDVEFSILDEHTQFDLIVNATTIGLETEDSSFFKNIFSKTKFAVDLNYKSESIFLKVAEMSNVEKRINGLTMLYGQAIASYELFFNESVPNKTEIIYSLKEIAGLKDIAK